VLGELGDPLSVTSYVACLYDGASARLMALRIPAGGTCGTAACWKSKGTKGFAYSNKQRTPDGVRKLALAPGPFRQGKDRTLGQGRRHPAAGAGQCRGR